MTASAQPLRNVYAAPRLLRLGVFPGITAMAGGPGGPNPADSTQNYGASDSPGGTS